MIALYCIGIILACYLGRLEALIFSNRADNENHPSRVYVSKYGENIHTFFTKVRIVAYSPLSISFLVISDINWLATFCFSTSLILAFPFFHDGCYYASRFRQESIPMYLFKWKDNSVSSDAKISMSYSSRLYAFILSLILMVISVL